MDNELLQQLDIQLAALSRQMRLSDRVQWADNRQSRRWVPPVHKRRVLLVGGDLLVLNTALFLTQLVQTNLEPPWRSSWAHFLCLPALSALWLVVGWTLGSYRFPKVYQVMYSLKATLSTAVIVGFSALLLPALAPSLPLRGSETVLFLLLALGLWRFIFARCFEHPVLDRRALVIGAEGAGCTLAETLAAFRRAKGDRYAGKHFELIGFIDDDVSKQGKVISDLPVLGTHKNMLKLVKDLRPDDLVLALPDGSELRPGMFQAILDCRELGVSIVRMQPLYESLTHQVPLEHTGTNLDTIMPRFPSIGQRLYAAPREALDILAAIPGLVVLGLMIPLVWTANFLTSRGPLFFRQERVGKSGEVFLLLKFRSMVTNAEAHTGGVWAQENDERTTPIGRFLRKSRLDELPQFWNVLKGEMSLIGPRPERPCFVEPLAQKIPFYRLRHAVKPGITGWAQVNYGYGASVEDAFVKLRYDLYYIKHQRVSLDLLILLKTVRLVLGFKGR
jgi:exopolysaccharide biosynthesis polyprenyl glycosylphosphotransferase